MADAYRGYPGPFILGSDPGPDFQALRRTERAAQIALEGIPRREDDYSAPNPVTARKTPLRVNLAAIFGDSASMVASNEADRIVIGSFTERTLAVS